MIERYAAPAGNTAHSSGMVPAAGTRLQREKGVENSPQALAQDIQNKAKGKADPALVEVFLHPGHSCWRMHAPASRTGGELIGSLTRAVERGIRTADRGTVRRSPYLW